MSKTFQLNYDIFGTNLTVTQIQGFMNESRRIVSWYQPFAGTFLIKSNESQALIRDGFSSIFGDAKFILSLVDVRNATGALDSTVWHWIYTDDDGFDAMVREQGLLK